MRDNWHIDRSRGPKRFPFAVCAPYNDGLPGTAVLGAFAYRPHAETAMRALAADPANNPPGQSGRMQIGAYLIRQCPDEPGKVWIEHESGEGGEFDARQLESAIAAFYGDQF